MSKILMNKIKFLNCLLLSLCLLVFLSVSCSKPKVDRDMDKLYEQLESNIQFSEKMKLMVDERIESTLDISEDLYENAIGYYTASGASVDIVLILEAKNQKALKSIDEKIDFYLQQQQKAFESYVPTEIPKLTSAVRENDGRYYVLVVSGDNQRAGQIVKEWLK